MADEMRALIQRRAKIKSQLTRFKSYLEKWSERPDEQQLSERFEKFKTMWDAFDEVQSSIELNTADAGMQSDDNKRALFEELYFELAARARRRLASVRPAADNDNATTVQNQFPVQSMRANIKLPTINLPTFSGNYEAWMGFYDNFKLIVHDNENLAPVQKLQYLRSFLTDEAAQVIQSLETSSQNYEVAWALVVERYDNRRIIIQSHIRALFDLPVISKESPARLRSLVDAALKHTRALHALGQPTESWDALLFHLLTSKLDRNSHQEWERSLDGTKMPSIDDFWKFLKNRCHVLESVSQEASVFSDQLARNQLRSSNNRVNTNQRARSALVTVHNELKCTICKQNHNIFQCEQFRKMTCDARFAKVKSMGLCYNCLRPNHLVDVCTSSACRKCNRKHHTLLHSEGDLFERGSGGSNVANASPVASLQAIVASQVLLATASVRMLNSRGEPVKCRVLLDNGSQSNFVTEKLLNILNLTKREVNIPVSGFNQSLTHIKHSITATLQSSDGRFASELSFLVVPRITETLPARAINRCVLNLPRNITLADPEFCTPSDIDAFIGAELFYQLLCVGQIRLGNALILQKTRLGWIASGTVHDKAPASNRIACNVVVDSLNAQVAPHHPVFKRDSHTTKSRVVFNASSRSNTGVLRNDVLFAGPTLQEDLVSTILRFRAHRCVMTADIEKMYKQVGFHHEDRKYQMILWRKSPKDPVRGYMLNTATYATVPASLKAKIMLQRLWEHKLNWDESVAVDIATSWREYREQVELLNKFIIPCQITREDTINVQLHGLCGASEGAYGAVLDLRFTTSLGIHMVRLICSETRVAPIKKSTFPRLELCAADPLGELYKTTIKSLRIDIDEEFFWSDSTIALHWIQTSPIEQSAQHEKWRHVPSQDNPADALSRRQFPRETARPLNSIPSIEIPEQRSIVALSNVHGVNTDLLLSFSSFAKMRRVIARCMQFVSKCRSLGVASEDLSVEDLRRSEMRIMKLVQLSAFESELRSLREGCPLDRKSGILSLEPFLDLDEVLRVGSRLRHADLTFSQKHPVLLPSNNHVSELIIRETHIKLCHAGIRATLYAIRENYWLLNGKNRVKEVIRKCVMCSRGRPSTPEYQMDFE